MISPGYAQTMARYNRWQNRSLYAAAEGLSDEQRRKDRGAFFRSIHGTLNHILWADSMWMSRISDAPKPAGGLRESAAFRDDWAVLKTERAACDDRIIAFANAIDESWLEGELRWRSAAINADLAKPRWLIVAHVFNHQTHHRGQVHAMLTAAGAAPDDTDLPFMRSASDAQVA